MRETDANTNKHEYKPLLFYEIINWFFNVLSVNTENTGPRYEEKPIVLFFILSSAKRRSNLYYFKVFDTTTNQQPPALKAGARPIEHNMAQFMLYL